MDRSSHPRPEYIRSYSHFPYVDNYENKSQPMYSYEPIFKGYPTPIYDPVNQNLAFSLPLEDWPKMNMNANKKPLHSDILTIYPGMNP